MTTTKNEALQDTDEQHSAYKIPDVSPSQANNGHINRHKATACTVSTQPVTASSRENGRSYAIDAGHVEPETLIFYPFHHAG
jgi:hypothetical protein